MKKKLGFVFLSMSLILLYILASCKVFVTKPSVSYSDIKFNSLTSSVTFQLDITDSESVGSNYIVNLANQSDTSSNTESQEVKNLSDKYTFENIVVGDTYTIYVSCTIDGQNIELNNKANFTATDESISQSLGIYFEDETVEYDKLRHYLYFYYDDNAVSGILKLGINGVSYKIQYDNSNVYQTEPGEYKYTINIYQLSGNYYSLVESITKTLIIKKASTLYTFNDIVTEYDGNKVKEPFTYEGLTYKYYDSNNKEVEPINPGTYTVAYEFTGDNYYEALSGTYTLTIKKGTITSFIKNQTIKLGEVNELKIDDESFSLSNVDYTVTYYDSNNNVVDKINSVGKYKAYITILENEFYYGLETIVDLNVVEELKDSIIVSNVSSFSVETGNYMPGSQKNINYYNYIQIYNNSFETIDLSNVSLDVFGQSYTLSGSIDSNKTYTVLIYSNSLKITINNFYFGPQKIDFSKYADQVIKSTSSSKLTSVKLINQDNTIDLTFATEYDDYFATLNNNKSVVGKNYVYNYSSCDSLQEVVEKLANSTFTTLTPTVSFNEISSISQTRLSELYDVVATDALGNNISITSDMIDLSNLTNENIGHNVGITYNIYDSYGNVLTFERNILYVDEEAPELNLNEDISRNVEIGAVVDLTKYFEAYDAVDGNIKISDSMIETDLDLTSEGVYHVTCKVSDQSGNVASLTIVVRVGQNYKTLSGISKETVRTNDTGEAHALPSKGNVKGLVIPVALDSATTVANKPISDINAAFNGNSANVSFESVSSYYAKSSYNKLNLTFDIYQSWVKLTSTKSYYDTNIKSLLKEALETVSNTYNLADYDSDKDGYIDAVWFVYDIPYDKNTNYFWAWTSDYSDSNLEFDGVKFAKCVFASYSFLDSNDSYNSKYNGAGSSKVTARTYIHETGHLLGLEDYYDYDYDQSVGYSHTMYGITMMDQNYGDLDAASKILLGWLDPVIISNDDVITIGSTALDSNNAIIISKSIESKGTIFSEYIVLEFWTPEGLNAYDAANTFGTNAYGVRVLHLDASINYVNGKATLTNGKRPSYFKYNNTDDDSKNFLETLAKNKDAIYNRYTSEYDVTNNVLFESTSTTFGVDIYSDFTYNTGDKLDFIFNISSISSTSVTITVDFK